MLIFNQFVESKCIVRIGDKKDSLWNIYPNIWRE